MCVDGLTRTTVLNPSTHPYDTGWWHLQHIHLALTCYFGRKPAMECQRGHWDLIIYGFRIQDFFNCLYATGPYKRVHKTNVHTKVQHNRSIYNTQTQHGATIILNYSMDAKLAIDKEGHLNLHQSVRVSTWKRGTHIWLELWFLSFLSYWKFD